MEARTRERKPDKTEKRRARVDLGMMKGGRRRKESVKEMKEKCQQGEVKSRGGEERGFLWEKSGTKRSKNREG